MVAVIRPRMKDRKDPSHITYQWGGDVIRYALSHGVDVLDITDPWVDYDKISTVLTQNRPDMILYTGHGCRNYLATQNGCSFTNGFSEDVCQQQCDRPANLKLMRGAIVVTLSCHSGDQLGRCAVKWGARSYAGFSDYLMFTTDSIKSQNIFRDALLAMPMGIIDGLTIGQAADITKALLYDKAKSYKTIKYLAIPLLWNYEYMQVQGDTDARLGG